MLATVIVAVLGALAALAGLAKRWADRKFAPIREDVAAVRYQAENNHGPGGKDVNLRDQLDEIQSEMRGGFRRIDHELGEMRRDLSDERADRRSGDQAIMDRLN